MLSPDFTDILSAFSAENVEYIIVGGYAIAFHGYVRGTGDIDLWIRLSDDNVEKVWRALKTFGAPLFDLSIEDFKTSGMVFQMGLPPNRIDIIKQDRGSRIRRRFRRPSSCHDSRVTTPDSFKTGSVKE